MNLRNYFFLMLCMPVALNALNLEQKDLMKKLVDYSNQKTILLSYPRSGNTWTRYCLEFLTQRPTFHKEHHNPVNQPLGWSAGFELDFNKPPIQKIHILHNVPGYNNETDKLILIVRNPKEAIKRHESRLDYAMLKDSHLYFTNITVYDSWNPENRILIFYEDLLTNPEKTLQKLGDFLNEPMPTLDEFMQNYKKHQQTAISLYRESVTQGKDLLTYSKQMGKEYCRKIDIWIEELYPEVWHKYLQHRYSEDFLDYTKCRLG